MAVATGAWVSQLVLAGCTCLLYADQHCKLGLLIAALGLRPAHERLVMQDANVVASALARFRAMQARGLSDCLVLEIAR